MSSLVMRVFATNLVTPIGNAYRVERTSLLVIASVLLFSTMTSESAPLNDTGIITFGDNFSSTLTAEPVDFPGQDASFGRDAAALAGTLTKIGGGRAGFDFTKLDAGGSALPVSAISWSCVRDNVTRLIWEVKTNDGGLRDRDNFYTRYNPDPATNGGNAGSRDDGSFWHRGECTGSACDTESYVQAINGQGLCGHSDWRLPLLEELRSIVDYGRTEPTIDITYFPNTNSHSSYISALPSINNTGGAWGIDFRYGYHSDRGGATKPYSVRLVRGGQ